MRVANTWASAGQTRQTATHSKPGRTLNYLNTEAQRLGRYRTMLGVPMLRGGTLIGRLVQEIVMEKVAEAVQKKAEEVQQQPEQRTEEKKDVL